MDIEPKDAATIVASGGGVLWLLAKLFRREMAEHRVDKANQKLIDELMSEKGKLLTELESKEKTIQRLIKEKEEGLAQISEVNSLKQRVVDLEQSLEDQKELARGMYRLITHILLDVDLDHAPKELRDMLKEELTKLQGM